LVPKPSIYPKMNFELQLLKKKPSVGWCLPLTAHPCSFMRGLTGNVKGSLILQWVNQREWQGLLHILKHLDILHMSQIDSFSVTELFVLYFYTSLAVIAGYFEPQKRCDFDLVKRSRNTPIGDVKLMISKVICFMLCVQCNKICDLNNYSWFENTKLDIFVFYSSFIIQSGETLGKIMGTFFSFFSKWFFFFKMGNIFPRFIPVFSSSFIFIKPYLFDDSIISIVIYCEGPNNNQND